MTRKWGGRKKIINVTMTEQDDKYSHIVTGNIVSPNQTDYTVRETIKWISNLPNNSNNNSN